MQGQIIIMTTRTVFLLTGTLHKSLPCDEPPFINTPLRRGGTPCQARMNRFSGFFTLPALSALLALALPALAADYTGKFQGDQLTVTLQGSDGRYSGTIQMGGRKLPCSGREIDKQLKGTARERGHPVPVHCRDSR